VSATIGEVLSSTDKAVIVATDTVITVTSNITTTNAQEINEAHRLARASAETAVQHAVRCGQLLIQQRKAMKYGEFTPWVKQNCEFSQATANNYMKAAKNPNALGISLRGLFPSGRPEYKASIKTAKNNTSKKVIRAVEVIEDDGSGDTDPSESTRVVDHNGDAHDDDHRHQGSYRPEACWRWEDASPSMQRIAREFSRRSKRERLYQVVLLADLLGVAGRYQEFERHAAAAVIAEAEKIKAGQS
jgi:hypothetical protein